MNFIIMPDYIVRGLHKFTVMMEGDPPALLLVCTWMYLGCKQMQMTCKTK